MSCSFARPPSALQSLSTVREDSNYDIIRAETCTYEAEDAGEGVGAAEGSQQEKNSGDFVTDSVAPQLQ